MSTPLRPMTLGEILDRAFHIYREQFWTVIIVAAMPAMLLMLAGIAESTWLMYHPSHGRVLIFYQSPSALLWTLAMFILGGICQLAVRPAFIAITASRIKGTPCSVSQAFAAYRRRAKDLIALNLFEQFAVLLVPGTLFLLGAVACSSAMRATGGLQGVNLLLTLCLLLWAVPLGALYVFAGVRLAFSFPALLFENRSWFSAAKRSWRLTSGSILRIFALWVALFVIAWIANTVARWSVFGLLHAFSAPWLGWGRWMAYRAGYALCSAVISTALAPIYPIALTLLYYDQRIRREGLDIEWIMRAAGMDAPQTVAASSGGETA